MDESVRTIAAVLSAVGATVIVPKLASALWKAVTGRPARQRREIDRVRSVADDEAYKRRLAEEHASHLRRLAYEAPCIRVEDIPPWPTYHRKKEPTDDETP
ncbi:hypothetical protein [Microbacterium trichothecenolyticum]|uniref:hypothetical protein n=1 Tax=Microbacterium trichothecenolyticum TaxID=69370 RepID=UPI0012EDEFD9|nr:hypothetical protein [Microbacterium trichothecenolyticum]